MARRRLLHPCSWAGLAALLIFLAAPPGIAGAPADASERSALLPGDALGWRIADETAVERLLPLVVDTIRANAVEVEIDRARVAGFSAGTTYPQLWIRDSASVLPTARHLLGESFLVSWIRAHLRVQDGRGAVQDWVAVDGSTDKNTVEADQESALIQAAATATRVIGPAWLGEPLDGRLVIQRLDAALEFVLRERRDPATGLVASGHTADWGDVTPEFPDYRATDLHPGSRRVLGIYTQAMAMQAMTDLAAMHEARGDAERAGAWRERAVAFRERVRSRLWDAERGFFRLHRHVDGGAHPEVDEADMFGLGGNVVAARAGLAGAAEAREIAREALRRQRRYGVSTPAGVLLPPYPAGFFQHPWLDEPFEYQNGGQWDWFGGRLALLMYELGMPEADATLRALASKAATNGGLHEWDSSDGEGRGSGVFAGSAGALGQAVIQGLFGVAWERGEVRLAPRLGTRAGAISLPQPATGERFAYAYRYDSAHRRLSITLDAPPRMPVTLELADLPEAGEVARVTLDGAPLAFARERGPAGSAIRITARRGQVVVELR